MVTPVKAISLETHLVLKLSHVWAIVAALGVAAVSVIGTGIALNAKIAEVQKDVATLRTWIKKPGEYPASKSLTDGQQGQVSDPAPKAPRPSDQTPPPPGAPVVPEMAPSPAPPPQSFPLKTIPSDVKPYAPPVCVEKTTHRTIACHDARECYPRGAFTPEHFAKVMAEAGVDSPSAQICVSKE
jgi:hypothetical protein